MLFSNLNQSQVWLLISKETENKVVKNLLKALKKLTKLTKLTQKNYYIKMLKFKLPVLETYALQKKQYFLMSQKKRNLDQILASNNGVPSNKQ